MKECFRWKDPNWTGAGWTGAPSPTAGPREDGSPELPRFLCHRSCVDMSDRIFVNMLESYGIPCLCVDPGNGGFARVVMGMSGQGVDIYVPKSLYDDADALSKEENNEEL